MRVFELAEAVGNEHRALDAIIRRLSSEQMRQKISPQLTVKDMLGHIAAYDGALRMALAAGVGKSREEPGYFDDRHQWNQDQYALRRERTLGTVVAELHENGARYLSLIKSLHEEDLAKQIRYPWDERGTVHAMIVDGLGHAREQREALEAALGQAG